MRKEYYLIVLRALSISLIGYEKTSEIEIPTLSSESTKSAIAY